MKQELIKPNERLDDLQNGYCLIQDPSGFCFGMDAVLFSSFIRIHKGESLLDLGTGTGILPVLLAARTPAGPMTGLEIQPAYADMARRSVLYNGLEDRIRIVQGDIKEAATYFGAASFHVVISNPPYMPCGRGKISTADAVAAARHEILCTLKDVIVQAKTVLVDGGRLFLVHRPVRLAEIMWRLKENALEPKRMRLVYPYSDRKPNLVLLEARKGGGPGLETEPPLIVFQNGGIPTEEVENIYGRKALLMRDTDWKP